MRRSITTISFLVEEDPDWEPGIAADLEAILDAAEFVHLVWCQLPSIQLEVTLDTRLGHRLGNHTTEELAERLPCFR